MRRLSQANVKCPFNWDSSSSLTRGLFGSLRFVDELQAYDGWQRRATFFEPGPVLPGLVPIFLVIWQLRFSLFPVIRLRL